MNRDQIINELIEAIKDPEKAWEALQQQEKDELEKDFQAIMEGRP